MKKFTISLIIIVVALVSLNFAALFMHKKSLDVAISSAINKIEASGMRIDFGEVNFTSYKGWSPAFQLPSISLKYGDKRDRSHLLISDLHVHFMPFEKKLYVQLKEEIKVEKNSLKGKEFFAIKFDGTANLECEFDSSVDLFLRNMNVKPFSRMKHLHLHNNGFEVRALSSGEDPIIMNSKGILLDVNRENISAKNSKENYILKINGEIQAIQYNKNFKDQVIKSYADLGSSSTKIALHYSFKETMDGNVDETFALNELNAYSDKFMFSVFGNGRKTKDSILPEVRLEVKSSNYKFIADLYCKMLNDVYSKSTNGKMIFANQRQISQLIKIFEDLPAANVGKDDISFEVLRTLNSDFSIGGEDWRVLRNKILAIFPHYAY